MTKKLNPKPPDLRQGQTIYFVFVSLKKFPRDVFVCQYHLYSHRTLLPSMGERIENMPVSHARKIVQEQGSAAVFYSKRKAMTAGRRLEHLMKVEDKWPL